MSVSDLIISGTTLEEFHINDVDDAAIPKYYGFEDKGGNWYILRESPSGAYRYSKGDSSYSTNWTNRGSLTYDYFSVIF